MKRVIAIRHVPFEDLGVFESELRSLGFAVEYVEATSGDFAGLQQSPPDLLVVLGGPIGAFDEQLYPFLVAELQAIQDRINRKLPILGICLGAQLIARAFGEKVYPMGHKEIGYFPLELTEEGRDSVLGVLSNVPVLHWHGDQFDIPPGARALAASSLCPNQAFSFGDNVLALQFHVEASPQHIESWLVGHTAELAGAGIDPRKLRREAQEFGPTLTQAAFQVLHQWLKQTALLP